MTKPIYNEADIREAVLDTFDRFCSMHQIIDIAERKRVLREFADQARELREEA
jgi:acyl-CoA reductase-like NAD-dependent aldehyde dehydrogenase